VVTPRPSDDGVPLDQQDEQPEALPAPSPSPSPLLPAPPRERQAGHTRRPSHSQAPPPQPGEEAGEGGEGPVMEMTEVAALVEKMVVKEAKAAVATAEEDKQGGKGRRRKGRVQHAWAQSG
jgi:hypothetical protein